MSELTNMIEEMVERLFANGVTSTILSSAESGVWHEDLWSRLEESGLPSMLTVPREQGGEMGWREAFLVIYAAGRHCLPLPLPEAVTAGWLLAASGLAVPNGRLGIAGSQHGEEIRVRSGHSGYRVNGKLARIPWGRYLHHLVFPVRHLGKAMVAIAQMPGAEKMHGANLVGEPRDDFILRDHPVLVAPCPARFDIDATRLLGALVRSAQMAGAVSAVLEQSVAYAGERQQFGRSIGSFQAVQHMLAVLAEESAAATMAAEQAFLALEAGGDPGFAIAVAKIRTGESAGNAAAIGHQVLGAMGFAREHRLHHSTRRLWAWRAEFGAEAEWAQRLAALALPHGSAGLWPFVTAAYSTSNRKDMHV